MNPQFFQTAIMVQLSYDKNVIFRKVYNFGDWSADVGGFTATVGFIALVVMTLCKAWSIEHLLINYLYKHQAPIDNKNLTNSER